MRKKQLYFFLLAVFLASVLYLIGLPDHAVGTSPLPQTNLAIDLASKFQSLQVPSNEPQQTGVLVLKKAPLPFTVQDDPVALADQETFYSIADATISEGYPSLTGGDTVDMWAGYDPIYDAREVRSLVKFNINNLPPDMNITGAILRVRLITSADIEGKSRTIRTYRVGENWSEGSVTWNNKPSFKEGYGSTNIVHAAWGWYEFDVTDLVKGWYDGTYTNYGLMLRGPDSSNSNPGWRGFSTREGPDPPQLVVNYVSVTGPPNAPTGLSATAVSKTQINLTWQDNSADETAFHIARSPDGTNWVEIGTVSENVTSYSNIGLDCDTTYHFRVRAYRDGDKQYSAYSDPPATATTLPCEQTICLPFILAPSLPPTPAPVLDDIANADGDGNYMVSWSAVNGANSYVLEEDDNAAFSSPDTRYTGPDTSWNASGKAAGTYYYRVKASISVGESGWSNVESVTVLPPIPPGIPDLDPCPSDSIEFNGRTNQNRPIKLCVANDKSSVNLIQLNYSISCGSHHDVGAKSVFSDKSKPPIVNQIFQVDYKTNSSFDMSGEFGSDFGTATGTWQGVVIVCSGLPGPCWVDCRGPVGQWSANR